MLVPKAGLRAGSTVSAYGSPERGISRGDRGPERVGRLPTPQFCDLLIATVLDILSLQINFFQLTNVFKM